MRILDHLLTLDPRDSMHTFAQVIRQNDIPGFIADDVAAYVLARLPAGTDFGQWVRALPPVAPPFPRWWTEWRGPDDPHMRAGVITTVTTDRFEFEKLFGGLKVGRDAINEALNDGKWFIRMTGIAVATDPVNKPGQIGIGNLGTFGAAISAEGRVTDAVIIQQNENQPEENACALQHASVILSTMYQLLAFLACKNVEVEDRPAPRHERRRAQREGKPEPFTFKTLSIHPTARRSGGREGPRSNRGVALHTVRGHFKTFDDHALFGRVKGTFFWNSQVRGSADRVVEKQYEVKSK